MRFQLHLADQRTIGQAKVVNIQLTVVGKILIVVTDAFPHATQHHRTGLRYGGFQQNVGAVIGEVETSARIRIMSAEIHAPLVDDKQKLQGIDQAGFADVVRPSQ